MISMLDKNNIQKILEIYYEKGYRLANFSLNNGNNLIIPISDIFYINDKNILKADHDSIFYTIEIVDHVYRAILNKDSIHENKEKISRLYSTIEFWESGMYISSHGHPIENIDSHGCFVYPNNNIFLSYLGITSIAPCELDRKSVV